MSDSIPSWYIRYFLKEVHDRVKDVEHVLAFLEEHGDIENRLGLAMQKVRADIIIERSSIL